MKRTINKFDLAKARSFFCEGWKNAIYKMISFDICNDKNGETMLDRKIKEDLKF